MRTTIDLPDDLHRVVTAVAHDRGQTLSQTVASLLRKTLRPGDGADVGTDSRTGLRVVRLGRTLTSDDVRRLDDEP